MTDQATEDTGAANSHKRLTDDELFSNTFVSLNSAPILTDIWLTVHDVDVSFGWTWYAFFALDQTFA
jgi:hypothetical protein